MGCHLRSRIGFSGRLRSWFEVLSGTELSEEEKIGKVCVLGVAES